MLFLFFTVNFTDINADIRWGKTFGQKTEKVMGRITTRGNSLANIA